MARSSKLALLDVFISAACEEDRADDQLCRQAALTIRKIKARNDKDDTAVWDELRERLDECGHESEWMQRYNPTDDPRTRN